MREVERLLAADPAAQQALDELRTLSATLQALPRRELGEDLSRQVLREAQRRMLSEGEPGERELSSALPVPLTRSVFRRFVNRRTVFWLALTAAIVVMITINEREKSHLAGGQQPPARWPDRPPHTSDWSTGRFRRRASGPPPASRSVVPQSSGARRRESCGPASPAAVAERRIAEQPVCRGLWTCGTGRREGPTRRRRAAARQTGAVRGQIPRPTGRQETNRRGRVGGPVRHQPPGRQERSLR